MKKFIGGCLDTVALKGGILECAMGLQNVHDQVMAKIKVNSKEAKRTQKLVQDIEDSFVTHIGNPVAKQYQRMEADPGRSSKPLNAQE